MISTLKYFAIAASLLICQKSIAQTAHLQQHAIQIASSDNSAVLLGASALFANPAAARQEVTGWDLTSAVSNRFNTDILSVGASVVKSFDQAAVGIVLGSYGIDGFKQNQVSLSFTRAIGASAYLGIQANYHQLQIDELGQKGVADMTIGYWQSIDNKVIISAYLKNPLQATSDQPQVIGKADIGIGYIISDQLTLYAAVDKPWDQGVSFRPGFAYQPHRTLTIYVSTDTDPEAISLGAGLNLIDGLNAQLGVNTHPILGTSLALSVGYRIQ